MLEIIGTYPPPYGGVSVHIKRILPFLEKNSIPYVVYNKRSKRDINVVPVHNSFIWFIKHLLKKNKNVVHFHIQYYGLEYLYFFLFSKLNTKKIFITIHNEYLLHSLFKKMFFFLLKHTQYLELIVVSDKVSVILNKKKIKNCHLPAYVPQFEKNILKSTALSSKKKNIVLSVYDLKSKKIFDVYGLDYALKLIFKLPEEFELKIFVSKFNYNDHYVVNELIKSKNLSNRVKLIYNKQLINFFYHTYLYIRPYRRDGYGISIQEALELDVLVVASDVCKRPKGTIVFKTDDFVDFESKVLKVIFMNQNAKAKLQSQVEKLKYHFTLVSMYKKYL